MNVSEPIIRTATLADLAAFYPGREAPTLKAWVGVEDGAIIGVGGYAFRDGRWFAFCDLAQAARRYRKALVKTGRKVVEEADLQGIAYLYAERDPEEPGAGRWLASLGFETDPRTEYLFRRKRHGNTGNNRHAG